MFSLRQKDHSVPSMMQYRLSRFMLSRVFWLLKNFVIPLGLISFVLFQIWSSDGIRNSLAETRDAAFQKFAYFPLFVVDEVVFENATELREEEILSLIDFQTPKSIMEIDRDALRTSLSQVDAVGSTEIRYSYNGTMRIILEPRIPTMIFFDGEKFATIDKTGHRVESLHNRTDRPELFVISGEGATDHPEEAQAIVNLIAPFSDRVRGLVRVGERRWDIVLANGGKLMLPTLDPIASLHIILKQHRTNDVLNRDIKAYDMRNPERPILRLSPTAIDEVNRLRGGEKGQAA